MLEGATTSNFSVDIDVHYAVKIHFCIISFATAFYFYFMRFLGRNHFNHQMKFGSGSLASHWLWVSIQIEIVEPCLVGSVIFTAISACLFISLKYLELL